MPPIPPMPNLTEDQLIVAAAALAVLLLIGLLLGYILGKVAARSKLKKLSKRDAENKDMRKELDGLRAEYQAERRAQKENHELYRGEVRDHFEQTGKLMTQMVDNYRHMYQHLATGANNLADMRETKLVSAPPPEAITDNEAAKQHSEQNTEESMSAATTQGSADASQTPFPRPSQAAEEDARDESIKV